MENLSVPGLSPLLLLGQEFRKKRDARKKSKGENEKVSYAGFKPGDERHLEEKA